MIDEERRDLLHLQLNFGYKMLKVLLRDIRAGTIIFLGNALFVVFLSYLWSTVSALTTLLVVAFIVCWLYIVPARIILYRSQKHRLNIVRDWLDEGVEIDEIGERLQGFDIDDRLNT